MTVAGFGRLAVVSRQMIMDVRGRDGGLPYRDLS
jgi:hypothetical protein